jgi:integrase/recombinase XerD
MRRGVSPLSVRLPLAFLREVGVVPAAVPSAVEGPFERLLDDYRRYLAHERGLAQGTIENYGRVARLFLGEREQAGGLRLERLSAADVSGFLARECPRRTVPGARKLVECLRPLLRYLHVAGLIQTPLRWAVPGVADLRDRSLPRGLEPAAVKRLLASCDRRRTVGRRDYAVLLLLARLGLRAGEVAALTLEDIDWRRGEIVVRGKGARLDQLPLTVDVGEVLVSYLRRRPSSEQSRALFLKVQAPAGPLEPHGVKDVVREACRRAGMPSVGPHRLRHTAATEMLRRGASLPEIGQVLRHRDIRTTARYAKVDRAKLRVLALPWPGDAA